MEINDIISLVNSGGNIALCICVYFINKVSIQLARIEKALQEYMGDTSQ